MIWFISDTHFGHKNIVRGVSTWTDKSGCRDFDSIEAHDTYILNLINTHVGHRDVLWHLGDFSFGGEANIQKYRDRIQCETVHMIFGNHDHHIQRKGPQQYGFASGQHYRELVVGTTPVVLCHYPIESWSSMETGAIHLHGHVHGGGRTMAGRMDLGIEAHGLVSGDMIQQIPKAVEQRHQHIAGGNKFGL